MASQSPGGGSVHRSADTDEAPSSVRSRVPQLTQWSRFQVDQYAIRTDPAVSDDAAVFSLTTHKNLKLFARFSVDAVERDFQRYTYHGGVWSNIANQCVIVVLSSIILATFATNANELMDSLTPAFIGTATIFALVGLVALLVTTRKYGGKSSLREGHLLCLYSRTIERLCRPPVLILCMAVNTVDVAEHCHSLISTHQCDYKLQPLSASLLNFWFYFTYVQDPRDSVIGACAGLMINVILGASLEIAPVAGVLLFATFVFAFCAMGAGNILVDTNARRTYTVLAQSAVADSILRKLQRQMATVVQAALPIRVVDRLANMGGTSPLPPEALYDVDLQAAVCITGAVDFGLWASRQSQIAVIGGLHHLYSIFDQATELFGVDQATTFGDQYVVTAGLIRGRRSHVLHAVRFALWQLEIRENQVLRLRSAIAVGPLVGGIGGAGELRYILGGEALAVASALYQLTPAGKLYVSAAAAAAAKPMPAAGDIRFSRVPHLPGVASLSIADGEGCSLTEELEYPSERQPRPSEESLALAAAAFAPSAIRSALTDPPSTPSTPADPPSFPQTGSELAVSTTRFALKLDDPAAEALFVETATADALATSHRAALAVFLALLAGTIGSVFRGLEAIEAFVPWVLATVVTGVGAATGFIPATWTRFRPRPAVARFLFLGSALLCVYLVALSLFFALGEDFISSDPTVVPIIAAGAVTAVLCRPLNAATGTAYAIAGHALPFAVLEFMRQSVEYSGIVISALIAGLVLQVRRRAFAFRTTFALARQSQCVVDAAQQSVAMLHALSNQVVPQYMFERGMSMIERDARQRAAVGEFNASLVSQLRICREQLHMPDVVESMSDFVAVYVRLTSSSAAVMAARAADRSVSTPATAAPSRRFTDASTQHRQSRRSARGVTRLAAHDTHGGHLLAAGAIACPQLATQTSSATSTERLLLGSPASLNPASSNPGSSRDRRTRASPPGPPVAVGATGIVGEDVMRLWGALASLVAEVSGGSLKLIQALGDDFLVGGPFVSRPTDVEILPAANAAVSFLLAMHMQLGLRFTAAACLDEAQAALVGRGALRYRVFGEAVRQAQAFVEAVPSLHGTSYAAFTPGMMRVVAPMVVREPVSHSEELTWIASNASLFFGRPQRWRVRNAGLRAVYPLKFPATDAGAASQASATSGSAAHYPGDMSTVAGRSDDLHHQFNRQYSAQRGLSPVAPTPVVAFDFVVECPAERGADERSGVGIPITFDTTTMAGMVGDSSLVGAPQMMLGGGFGTLNTGQQGYLTALREMTPNSLVTMESPRTADHEGNDSSSHNASSAGQHQAGSSRRGSDIPPPGGDLVELDVF